MLALVRALEIDPAWLFWDYVVDKVSDKQVLLKVTECKAQRSRVRMGRGINPDCRKVDGAYLSSFARVVDPMIRVRCNFGPPDGHTDKMWCEWCFCFGDQNG
jgi:hypothetical protein